MIPEEDFHPKIAEAIIILQNLGSLASAITDKALLCRVTQM